MLESRSAYFPFEHTSRENVIYKKMLYYEYKTRYPECKNLGDYDKIDKTITVVLPSEYADRPNFGNRYSIQEFHFVYSPADENVAGIRFKAKNYQNALKNANRWARQNGKTIVGDAPGYENQSNW